MTSRATLTILDARDSVVCAGKRAGRSGMGAVGEAILLGAVITDTAPFHER